MAVEQPSKTDVLIVEDDPDVRETLAWVLADHGLRTVTATHGAAAIGLLRSGVRPKVVLLDLWMPVMDGWQFRLAQAADPSFASIPVVIMTAMQGGRQAARELGAREFFPKPIDVDRLVSALSRLLNY